MIILALDTTTKDGSVAVVIDGVVRVERAGDPGVTHGQRLPAELTDVLTAAHAGIADVDLFAVAAGPGSFTGLRVGIATIQGLAMAQGKRIVAVSALDALARAAGTARHAIAAWMDAQRGEVFAALYGAGGRDLLIPPVSALPAAVLQAWAGMDIPSDIAFIGDGAMKHRECLARTLGDAVRVISPPPLAGIIGRMAAEDPGRAVLPHGVVPLYIRPPDAELARARRAAGH